MRNGLQRNALYLQVNAKVSLHNCALYSILHLQLLRGVHVIINDMSAKRFIAAQTSVSQIKSTGNPMSPHSYFSFALLILFVLLCVIKIRNPSPGALLHCSDASPYNTLKSTEARKKKLLFQM